MTQLLTSFTLNAPQEMFLCRRLPVVCCSIAPLRHQVTISWPNKKGTDYLAWNKIKNTILTELREDLIHHQSTKPYRYDYNFKIRTSKDNIAKIMGVDPEKFSDTDFKLSLLYLLPSDIQRMEYKPHIPKEFSIQPFLDIISKYNSDETQVSALTDSHFKCLRKEIRLVHGIVMDALEKTSHSPGLELFINPDEIITGVEVAENAEGTEDSAVASEAEDSPVNEEVKEFEEVNVAEDSLIDEEVEDALVNEEIKEFEQVNVAEDSLVVEEVENAEEFEVPVALLAFPFTPVQSGSEMENRILRLQFNKLNHTIQDRPDLICSYYPALEHLLQRDEDNTGTTSSVSMRDVTQTQHPVFRGKVNRVFLFNSVVTTAIPGSGSITINGQSYLDFFPEILSRMIIISPLRATKTLGVFDIAVQVDQENPEKVNSLAHCIAMSIADCIQQFNPRLKEELGHVYRKQWRVEYKKAHKKNSRRRYPWRKR